MYVWLLLISVEMRIAGADDGDVPFFRLLFLVLTKPQSLMIHEQGPICYLFSFSDSLTMQASICQPWSNDPTDGQ